MPPGAYGTNVALLTEQGPVRVTMQPLPERAHLAAIRAFASGAGSAYGDARAAASGLDAVALLMADAREQLLAEHDVVR